MKNYGIFLNALDDYFVKVGKRALKAGVIFFLEAFCGIYRDFLLLSSLEMTDLYL
jgi:hypothetical protein